MPALDQKSGDYDDYGYPIYEEPPLKTCNQECMQEILAGGTSAEQEEALVEMMQNNNNVMDYFMHQFSLQDQSAITDVWGEMSGFFRERCERDGY